MNKNSRTKRGLALLLALTMVISMVSPSQVSASPDEETRSAQEEVVTVQEMEPEADETEAPDEETEAPEPVTIVSVEEETEPETEAETEAEEEDAEEDEEADESEETEEDEEAEEADETDEAEEAETPEEETEAESKAVVLNKVAFSVDEGAVVTVNGTDVTNKTANAEDGTIRFKVKARTGYEITEVLVDGKTPARTTDRANEYIIEHISSDNTVVSVATQEILADANTYRAIAKGVKVVVDVPDDALPEGTRLKVTRYEEDSPEYVEAGEVLALDDGTEMAAMDISFFLNGEEVEPRKPVKVSIDASGLLPEDADPSTLEVQHLVEREDQEELEAVVVANTSDEIEGTIDEENRVAEFEVESFSSFTITWAGNDAGENTTSVTVYVYDINGLGIYDSDEQGTYTWDSGTHTIANLIEEHVSGKIGDGYTYAYATVQYLTTNDRGGEVTTIGSAEDPVISVTWNGTSYTVTTSTGSTTVASSDADEFYINLYFSTPMVSISVTNADTTNHTVSLTADTEYFEDSDIAYTWEITSGEEYASISGNGADATVTWIEGDEAGTDITVRVTATSASGETATATYDLEYGMTQVTYTVYYDNGRTLASGAHVAIYDENGNLVSNGEAGENGQVTLWIIPGTTYTLEASYTASSGSGQATSYTHYSYEDTSYVYVGDGTDDTTINLETSDANFYEHVDVKLSIAEEDADYSDILANVDYVKIYDEAGELVYQSSQLVHNSDTNDFNVLFADADGNEGTNPHSIAFYDSYSIEIAYEVSYTYKDADGNEVEYTDSYVATIDSSSIYAEGEYYSYNGTNAYQLYNEIYGTNYDATSFAAAVVASAEEEEGGLENYNANGISLDGLTYFFVAAALCDTKDTTNQAGLDLALGVTSLRRYSSTTWIFNVDKTLKNSEADAEEFTFVLYDAEVNNDVNDEDDDPENGDSENNDTDAAESEWSIRSDSAAEVTLSNGVMYFPDEGTDSNDIIEGMFSFNFDSSMVGQTQTYYFILLEETGDDKDIVYDDTVYGIKIELTLNSATDLTDVSIVETVYNLTESESEDESYRTFTQGEVITVSADDNGHIAFPFENPYQTTEITAIKVWNDDNNRDGLEVTDVNVQLKANGSNVGEEVTLNEGDDWSYTWTDLPVYSGGEEIEYTVEEVTSLEGYEVTVTIVPETDDEGNETGNYLAYVINSHEDAMTQITVSKEWKDDNSEERPTSVTVQR